MSNCGADKLETVRRRIHQIGESDSMTQLSGQLGRLERADLRSVWSSESDDFTPWLAEPENLRLLGETIGIELELEAVEKDVGPFRADILCKDVLTDHWVLIENQLERTNHVHLGQVLTYAAGLGAVAIVWIAAKFTEEHRAALDWLNDITGTDIVFFGLEVELWKIGDSFAAPKFNIVSNPNEWTRGIASGAAAVERGELTDNQKLQLRFWTGFHDYVVDAETAIRPSAPRAQSYMRMAPGEPGYGLGAVASLFNSDSNSWDTQELRAEFWFSGSSYLETFNQLESQRSEIGQSVQDKLHWYGPSDSGSRRVYIRKTVDLFDENKWPSEYVWLLEKLEVVKGVLAPQIRTLRSGE